MSRGEKASKFAKKIYQTIKDIYNNKSGLPRKSNWVTDKNALKERENISKYFTHCPDKITSDKCHRFPIEKSMILWIIYVTVIIAAESEWG